MGVWDNLFKRHNVERGKDIENEFKFQSEMQGHEVTRTGIGSDYKRKRVDPFTGRQHTEKWEVKRNNSPLSKRQKKTWGLKVYRSTDTPFGAETRVENRRGEELTRRLDGSYRKARMSDKDPFGIHGMAKRSSRKTSSNDPFGFSALGSSSATRKKKKDPFSLW